MLEIETFSRRHFAATLIRSRIAPKLSRTQRRLVLAARRIQRHSLHGKTRASV